MAIGSTVCKVQLSIADMDKNYYETHELTLAQHPSETTQRLMSRLVVFALNASDRLLLTKGIGAEDEPSMWEKNYGGEIQLWIELGQIDEKRIRKACGRSSTVIVYTYNRKSAEAWWRQNSATLERFKNLSIIHLNMEGIEALHERSMKLQCNINDSELSIHSERGDIFIVQERWQA